jgi:hypothetical protein
MKVVAAVLYWGGVGILSLVGTVVGLAWIIGPSSRHFGVEKRK